MKAYKVSEEYAHFAKEPMASYLTAFATRGSAGLDLIQKVRAGIKTGYLLYLGEVMGLSLHDLSKILNVSLRTLQRYAPDFVLDADASSKVTHLSMLQSRGLEVFGDQNSFNEWLKSPVSELEGKAPKAFLDTPFGFQILDQILGRIEHGIFA